MIAQLAATATAVLVAMSAAVARPPEPARIGDAYALDLQHGAGRLGWFVAPGSPSPGADVAAALVVQHGYGRDVARSLAAGALAAERAGRTQRTVVVAPLFQVAEPAARHCGSGESPRAKDGDALWNCASWSEGGEAQHGGRTSFGAYDDLLAELKRRWPKLSVVTIAGFSAGGQFVQRYVGFATPPAGVRLRFVVADPGTFLYFDARRPAPVRSGGPVDWGSCSADRGAGACDFAWTELDPATQASCPDANRWKHGLDGLPSVLGRSPAEVRARYAQADIAYVEGALDTGTGAGAFFKLLEKTCAARLQGPFRLQRGLAYAAYDRQFVAPDKARAVTVVAGCAHDVACVLPSPEVVPLLFAD